MGSSETVRAIAVHMVIMNSCTHLNREKQSQLVMDLVGRASQPVRTAKEGRLTLKKANDVLFHASQISHPTFGDGDHLSRCDSGRTKDIVTGYLGLHQFGSDTADIACRHTGSAKSHTTAQVDGIRAVDVRLCQKGEPRATAGKRSDFGQSNRHGSLGVARNTHASLRSYIGAEHSLALAEFCRQGFEEHARTDFNFPSQSGQEWIGLVTRGNNEGVSSVCGHR